MGKLSLAGSDISHFLSEYRTSLLCIYQMYRVAKGDPHNVVKKERKKETPDLSHHTRVH
jgi:hypothetical protein